MEENQYLNADALQPLITEAKLKSELLIYNLDKVSTASLLDTFTTISGKTISPESSLKELSGGQKVLLMALLALFSPAKAIRFINLMPALDLQRRQALGELIDASPKEIILEEKPC